MKFNNSFPSFAQIRVIRGQIFLYFSLALLASLAVSLVLRNSPRNGASLVIHPHLTAAPSTSTNTPPNQPALPPSAASEYRPASATPPTSPSLQSSPPGWCARSPSHL